MSVAEQLEQKFDQVFSGQPWYGRPVYDILEEVTFEAAYEKPTGSGHSNIEILLHMLSWTEEVTERMRGKFAGTPKGGDWPEAGDPDEQRWPQLVNYLKLANVDLIRAIRELPAEKWKTPINDERGDEPVSTYKGLIDGFIQHQIYHAGQIVLLTRLIIG